MQTHPVPRSVRTRKGGVLIVPLLAVLALLVGGAGGAQAANSFPFSACTTVAGDIVSPSCFEGADGNLTVDNAPGDRIDWSSLTGLAKPATQYRDPRNPADDVFDASTAKEATPGQWNIISDKVPSKADILNTIFYADLVPHNPGKIFFYGGFENTAGGNVDVSFELNHGAANGNLTFDPNNPGNPACNTVPASSLSCIPYRSENDVLITYDGTINNVTIGLCYWHGNSVSGNWFEKPNGGGFQLGGPNHNCPTLSHTQAEGNINGTDLSTTGILDTTKFSNPIPMGDFGEVAVNLSDTITSASTLCFSFGGVWMHSRSSPQADSTMQDFTEPQKLNGATSCSMAVNKTVAVSSDGTKTPTTANSDAGLTYAKTQQANNNDFAYYKITVTNTGTETITHDAAGLVAFGTADVADNKCASPTLDASDQLHPVPGNPTAADPTTTSFDGGDVWIFRCKRQYVAGDPDSLVNTVTVNGQVGSTAMGPQQSSATVTRVAPGQLTVRKVVVGTSGTFGFTSDNSTFGSAFSLGNNAGDTDTHGPVTLAPGTVTVTETDPGSTWAVSISCTNANAGAGAGGGAAGANSRQEVITVNSGDDITCTWTNIKQPTVKAAKVVSAGKGGETFPLTVAGTTTAGVGNGQSTPNKQIVPGNKITVSEGKQDGGPAGTFTSAVSCLDANATPVTVANNTGTSIDVTPAAGQVITCTFTNRRAPDPPPPPPPGPPGPVPHPAISIDKVGPAQALAGSAVVYGIGVTNTGDQPLAEATMVLSDPLCTSTPTLVSKLGDQTPDTLDPGETWGYQCTVQTQVGQASVHNVASVDGVDPFGTHVTASDPADTTLIQPQIAVEPLLPASARLRGPAACVSNNARPKAVVTGRRMQSVTFFVDGRKIKTVKVKNGRATLTLNRGRTLGFGRHKVTARVTFLAGSTLKTKTVAVHFARCLPHGAKPLFTG